MITLWNPVTQVFEASTGTPPASESVLLLNLLIEARLQTKVLLAIASDVIKDDEQWLRQDAANDTPNFVTGPPGQNP